MNRIIKEIGLKRLGKYFIFSFWQAIFNLLIFSPLRVFWLRVGGAKISKGCVVDKIDFINLDRAGLVGFWVGRECFLGRGALFDLAGEIILHDQVTVSSRACILSHFSVGFANHPLITKYPKAVTKTVIQTGSFIGLQALILPGVQIGRESLIGAGSVVTKNIPAFSKAAGVPAKIIK